jgi:4-hydroxybenzoate polyprenyltransferase
MKSAGNYFSLIKFSHTVFALPFALIGFFLAIYFANHDFSWLLFLNVLFCMVFARSAAMAFNRYIDRKIDEKNPRTSIREIPSGVIKPSNALAFTIINSLLFVATTWFINKLCFLLSPVALLVVLGYSYTKRFTWLCHIILGIGLSLAPIGAYLAVAGAFALLPLLFSLSVLFWVSGFDIIYALQDEVFDKENNLKSIPVKLGKAGALKLSIVFHLLTFLFLLFAGFYGNFGLYFWIGLLFFSALLVYQHTLVKPNDLSKVNIAFFTTNGIASIVFSAFVILDLVFS